MDFRKRKLNNKGLSIAELLVVIGILVVIIAIAIPSVFMIRKSLRQTELDAKAETVFTAVQNRMSKLRSAGLDALYKPTDSAESDESKSVFIIAGIPGDCEDTTLENQIFYTSSAYLDDAASAAAALMTEDVTEPELIDEHWVIEYNPESGVVYAVYYSESELNCADLYADASHVITSDYNDSLRVRANRLKAGAKVGYYGGSNSKVNGSSEIRHTVEIINAETLYATVKSSLPVGFNSESLLFKVTLSDGDGNSYTCYYSDVIRSDIKGADGNLYQVKYLQTDDYEISRVGRLYTLTIKLDSLVSDDLRFDSLYGSASGNNRDLYGNNRTDELTAGNSLTIDVEVLCPENKTLSGSVKSSNITNSLFADESNDHTDGDTAVIKAARHLQNLDALSNVSSDITKAILTANISMRADIEEGSFAKTYAEGYFNGTEEGKPIFKPIENDNLVSINGYVTDPDSGIAYGALIEGLYINSNGVNNKSTALGLFGTVDLTGRELEISDIYLAGASVICRDNSSAGALVGKVYGNGGLTLTAVGSYLAFEDYNGKTNNDIWIGGVNAGGLVGSASEASLSLTKCFAGSVVSGSGASSSTGGLIGRADSGSISIQSSYADTYLKGAYTGGLVGSSNADIAIDSCYSAGFETYSVAGAGFVCGKTTTISHSYTIESKLNPTANAKYYALAESGSASKVYYVVSGQGVKGTGTITKNTNIQTLLANLDSSSFTLLDASENTKAYNLMENQDLKIYEYPRINGLVHYCDWEASFKQGALVYFEHYSDDTWGFAGGEISTLKNNPQLQVTGDGYAIAFTEKIDADIKVALSDPTNGRSLGTITISSQAEPKEVTENEEKYYIYLFDAQVNNADYETAGFYIKAVIDDSKEEAYYFNPYFARTATRGEINKTPAVDQELFIRSARQLYSFAEYYSDYSDVTKNSTFVQEKDIDYANYLWSTYYDGNVSAVKEQVPVGYRNGGNTAPFVAAYNGQSHIISNISFASSDSNMIGMFGDNEGTISNVILYSYNNTADYFAKRSGIKGANVYLGALCGYNGGKLSNCAAAGFSLNSDISTVVASSNSRVYVGGLVGYNDANGKINNCSSDTPELKISSNNARVYAGGFAGANAGSIANSYAVGYINVAGAQGGSVLASGFTSENSGSIEASYCAVAASLAGESASYYGFAPKGGSVNGCYYLNNGTYEYCGQVFAYNADTSVSSATSVKYDQLAAISGGTAFKDYGTHSAGEQYPFKGAVYCYDGYLMHYGTWPDKLSIGNCGMFYWEHEEGGTNAGYHITYIGVTAKQSDLKLIGGTSLCASHDDGGIIVESGYGYFTTYGEIANAKVHWTEITEGAVNADAAAELNKQMPEYTFVPYTTMSSDESVSGNKSTNNHMFLTGTGKEGSVTLQLKNDDYYFNHTFTLAPYFANAIRYDKTTDGTNKEVVVDTQGANITGLDGRVTDYTLDPGSSQDNAYEIRNASQLQLINWNNQEGNAVSSLTNLVSKTETSTNKRYNAFKKAALDYTYLGSFTNDKTNNSKKYYWLQTHDVDNQNKSFTPIGCLAECNITGSEANVCSVHFDGTYDGQGYKIENIQISSSGQAIGLFSVAIGATLKNIMLYSDSNSVIKADSDGLGWYSLGSLVGYAAKGSAENGYGSGSITNCASAGYQIIDERANIVASAGSYNFGGSNIGGLAGAATVDVTKCEAVNDIIIRASYSSNTTDYIRAGGLIGSSRATVSDCYTGGSISSEMAASSTNIQCYLSGIVGGSYLRTSGNLGQLLGSLSSSIVQNSYTYAELPESNDASKLIYGRSPVANCPDADSASRMTIINCYYYDKNAHEADTQSSYTDGTATTLKYEDMTDDDFITKLGASWGKVTTVDAGGAAVDGKYSFNTAIPELTGKNYPFPTIVKQADLAYGTVINPVYANVHYGAWTIAGIYWEKGRQTMDIFNDMDACSQSAGYQEGYAYKEFKLHDPENDTEGHLVEKNADGTYKYLVMDQEGFGEIANISYNAETHIYTVLFKALKDGQVKIEAQYQGEKLSKAAFDLEITAEIEAFAATDEEGANKIEDPVDLQMDSKTGETFYLIATSVVAETEGSPAAQAKDLSKLVSWNITYDVQDVISDTLKDNACTIVREKHGTALLKAKAEYDYHGVKYEKVVVVTVSESGVVGYSIRFNGNGGQGTMADEPVWTGQSESLTANTFTRGGYTFTGWAFAENAATADYTDGQSIDVSGITDKAVDDVITLYAVWTENTYTVSFNGNGGQGTMSDESFTYSEEKALSENEFTNEGKTFAGWALSVEDAENQNVAYTDGQVVSKLTETNEETITLYAVWSDLTAKTVYRKVDAPSDGKSYVIVAEGSDGNKFAIVQSGDDSFEAFDVTALETQAQVIYGNAKQTMTYIDSEDLQNGYEWEYEAQNDKWIISNVQYSSDKVMEFALSINCAELTFYEKTEVYVED